MEAKRSFARAIVGPSLLAALGFVVLGVILGSFLRDHDTLMVGLGFGWLSFTTGRALGHYDRPRGRGALLRHVLAGVALGWAGWSFLNAVFLDGPGWPWTPWWALMGGFGLGLYRSHKTLLKQARADDQRPRWLGAFHPKDLEALGVLLGGYALLGLALFLTFRAFSGIIPGAGRLLAIGIAIYALHGARLLLRFASEERGARGQGFVGWLKANALQNAIIVLVLVAYAVFRDELARSVPFYPLVEFGLGIAVFGFVLGRLRARMRRDGSTLATVSEARDHVRVITELREADYDAIARPVTRFVESGLGREEYATAISAVLPNDARAEPILGPLRSYRDPPRPPALPMEWGFVAGGAMTLGLALAALVLGLRVFDAELPYPIYLALLFVGFGTYAQQDVARSNFRLGLSIGIAAAGVGVLLLDFLLFAGTVDSIAGVPGIVWGIAAAIALAMIGIPALVAWRLSKRLRAGEVVDARRIAPLLEHQNALQAARKRGATMMVVAVALLLPVPWLAGWLAERGAIPSDFPSFLSDILAVAIWVVVAFGGSAIIRFYGLTRGRPALVAREAQKRARRLAIHRTLMQSIERM